MHPAGIETKTQGKPPFSVVFFDPARAATWLWYILVPFSSLRFLILPTILLAAAVVFFNWHVLVDDIDRVFFSLSFLQSLVLGMLTANLMAKVAQSVAMVSENIPPRQFGIKLLFGVIPRFFISTGQIRTLPFARQRSCYAAPLLTRLMMFATGIVLWIMLRGSGSNLANLFVAFGITGLSAFIFTANPIWRADGYRWTSALLKRPQLRENAYTLLRLYLSGRPRPEAMPASHARSLALYAVVSILYTAILIGSVISTAAISLEARFQGTGVALFALVMAMVLMFFLTLASRRRKRQRAKTGKKPRQMTPSQNDDIGWYNAKDPDDTARPSTIARTSPLSMRSDDKTRKTVRGNDLDGTGAPPSQAAGADPDLEAILAPTPPVIAPDENDLFDLFDDKSAEEMAEAGPPGQALVPASQKKGSSPAVRKRDVPPARRSEIDDILKPALSSRKARPSLWWRLMVWVVVLGGLFVLGQQPYPFTVGGEFIIQPVERVQIRARTDGEVIQIHAREGDWVPAGSTLAVLSKWDEERDIRVLEAELEGLRAKLATLTAGPKAEEIALAEQVRAAAAAERMAAEDDMARAEQLFTSGTIARKALDEARTRLLVATAELERADAALALLNAPVLESEVEAALAEIRRTEGELEFKRLQLDHTNITAATDGQIVSDLAGMSIGTFLREGDLFAELADNRTVLAEIEVPETEIGEVTRGAAVELRPWSTPDSEIIGTVQRVAPAAEERDFGRIMRVLVEVPNAQGTLAGNMTGFAKISVDERPAWRAFSRVFIRFFEVEIWSWLP